MVNAEDIAYTQEPPRYVIDCNVEARPPHFFGSATVKSILKFNKIREEMLFGHDFEIYDKDKGFEAIHYSFDGIKNHFIAALHASFMFVIRAPRYNTYYIIYILCYLYY